MLRSLLRAIFERLLILLVLIVVSCTLPFATIWLLKSEIGTQVVFWTSPWVVCFWSAIAFNLVGSKFWRGREAVEEWKARRGPYLWRAFKGTCWMFSCLLASYSVEFGVLWETRSLGLTAAAAYIPLAFTLAWCSRG
jgi:hypothetical protein